MKAQEVPAYLLDIKQFECQQCASCCKNLRVDVTYSDLTRWKREGRWDILQRVALVEDRDGRRDFCLYETTAQNSQCPFLSVDNRCRIHPTKPQVCHHFPFNGSFEQVALCRGVGTGHPVPAQVCQTIYQRERRDLRRLQVHTYDVMNLLLCARVVERYPIESEELREHRLREIDDGCGGTNGQSHHNTPLGIEASLKPTRKHQAVTERETSWPSTALSSRTCSRSINGPNKRIKVKPS